MTRRTVATPVALAIALTFALTACVQQTPHVIPTAEPTSKPVFASDAAALAAAKKAYAGYLAASDEIAHDGGDGVERLRPWVSAAQFARDSKSMAAMKAEGHHTTGLSTYSNFTLESSSSPNDKASVVAYVCLRIDATTLLDSSDANVGLNRPLAIPLEVTFISNRRDHASLIVDGSVVWSGSNFCS